MSKERELLRQALVALEGNDNMVTMGTILNIAEELANPDNIAADDEIDRLQLLSDERFSQLLNMDKLVESIQDDRDSLLDQIKVVQSTSDECGLIGMIGSAAWISQLKKLAKPEQEPIAWIYDFTIEGETITDWTTTDRDEISNPENGYHNIRPLYLSPQQHRLLTDDDIKKIYAETNNSGWAIKFARAIEKAITNHEQS